MNSMTGFGKAQIKSKYFSIVVEISSVNNRYLEINPRLPRQLYSLEPKIRDLVKNKLNRGKVNLFVGFDETGEDSGKYNINKGALLAYHKQLSQLQKKLKLSGELKIKDLLILPDITKQDFNGNNEKVIWTSLEKTVLKALVDLIKMRQREGLALIKDMNNRIKILEREIKKINKGSGDAVKKYRDRLNTRLEELLEGKLPENIRIEEELALLAERTDISEECIRFDSHLAQYKDALKIKKPIGKKLNFILQELNREANTIASKCSDINISSSVIIVKEEIEKLREQVQNIE